MWRKVTDIREIQLHLLNTLDEFDRICNEHSLTYTLAAGTLLGAMLYHGFIPWDDDVDVLMPRPDFERFIELARGCEKRESFEVFYYPHKYYNHVFAKFGDVKSRIEKPAGTRICELPLSIDIAPLDGCPDDPVKRLRRFKTIGRLRHFIRFAYHERTFLPQANITLHRYIYNIILFAIKKLPLVNDVRLFISINEKMLKRIPFEKANYVADYHDYWKPLILKREHFFDIMRVPFEGRMLPVPRTSQAILDEKYGARWRVPLPPEEQSAHPNAVYFSDTP